MPRSSYLSPSAGHRLPAISLRDKRFVSPVLPNRGSCCPDTDSTPWPRSFPAGVGQDFNVVTMLEQYHRCFFFPGYKQYPMAKPSVDPVIQTVSHGQVRGLVGGWFLYRNLDWVGFHGWESRFGGVNREPPRFCYAISGWDGKDLTGIGWRVIFTHFRKRVFFFFFWFWFPPSPSEGRNHKKIKEGPVVNFNGNNSSFCGRGSP